MPGFGVIAAIMKDGKILLTKREDFEVWCLPGGGVNDGESLAEAVIREAKEETGLDVELTGLVGIYSRVGNVSPGHMVLFAAKPTGGELKCQPGETIAVEWFASDEIPSLLSPGHRRRIADAMKGIRGLAVAQDIHSPTLPDKITGNQLYELRDKSGLSRQEFYMHMMEHAEIKEVVEVGNE
jgi:ADP-ribose pyrophosphatase YjhB (NUDIX family)